MAASYLGVEVPNSSLIEELRKNNAKEAPDVATIRVASLLHPTTCPYLYILL